MSKQRARLINCGTFRKRAYHITDMGAMSECRVTSMEIDVQLGEL